MKKMLACLLASLLLFCGCRRIDQVDECVMDLRQKLQNCQVCSFQTKVTADYGDYIHEFEMDCQSDASGDLSFVVQSPETIRGITGTVSDTSGHLTFDDHVLAFDMLADGQATPASAPWIMLKALRGGYIRSCGTWEQGIKIIVDDSYQENSLQLTVWLDANTDPCMTEILWEGRRILSLEIEDFTCQ